jgi:hypothetical protein
MRRGVRQDPGEIIDAGPMGIERAATREPENPRLFEAQNLANTSAPLAGLLDRKIELDEARLIPLPNRIREPVIRDLAGP